MASEERPPGFDYWEVLPGQGDYYNPAFRTQEGDTQYEGYVSDIVTDRALEWLENGRDTDEPFLLMYQYKALVQNLDLAQTLLNMAGMEPSSPMQGRSLVPLLQGGTPEDWRESVYYHYYEFPWPHHVHPYEGVRTAGYKLIHYYTLDQWELFDLQADPDELRNVYGDRAYSETIAYLREELARLKEHYDVPVR